MRTQEPCNPGDIQARIVEQIYRWVVTRAPHGGPIWFNGSRPQSRHSLRSLNGASVLLNRESLRLTSDEGHALRCPGTAGTASSGVKASSRGPSPAAILLTIPSITAASNARNGSVVS